VSVSPTPDSNNTKPLTVNASTGLVMWTSTMMDGQRRTFTITVLVSDGHNAPVTQIYTLTVSSTSTNHPPTITSIPRTTIAIGQMYWYQVQASDPDFDPLTYSLPTKPSGMNINATSGLM
jgi:hypothetical protein